jgi:hypothetical protein
VRQRWIAVPAFCLVCAACTPFETREALDAPLDVLAAEELVEPVGTAFALDDGTYVTAAHVFDALIGSRYARPLLLDSQSALHDVANIVRYSSEDDFVVFTAKATGRTLAGRTAKSDRSAADRLMKAVRGPSGKQADIRVQPVLFALNLFQHRDVLGTPENTVFAPEFFSAEESVRGTQSRAYTISLDEEIPYARFAAQVVALRHAYFDATLNRWLRASERAAFLGGAVAATACELLNGSACSERAAAETDVVLEATEPSVLAQTEAGPTLETMWLDGTLVLRRKTSRGITLDNVFDAENGSISPQKLALATAKRWNDHTPPIELDTADPARRYTDLHGRHWQLRSWPVHAQDLKVIAVARPLAGGYVALVSVVPTSFAHATTLHLEILANIDSVAGEPRKSR